MASKMIIKVTQWKQKWMEKNFNLKNYTFGKQKQSKKIKEWI